MTTGLGLTVGSMNSVAVTEGVVGPESTVVAPTALAFTEAGAALLSDSGASRGAVVTGYAHRVGDPVGLIAEDGASHTGEELVAATMRCLADRGPVADVVVAAYPAVWSQYQVDVLADALGGAGLPQVTLVTEPEAAVARLAHTRPDLGDAPVVVFDLGARSLDVTVVQPAEVPEIIGTPIRSEDFSGAEFDYATMRYVLDGVTDATGAPVPFDAVDALAELRTRCRIAKESLSTDTAAVISVELPGVQSDVRFVRAELEDLIRDRLADSVALVHEAVRGAGLEPSDIGSVLLIGGSSAIPLVAEVLSTTLRLPVVADPEPMRTAAAGAAVLALRAAATTAATPAARDSAAFAMLDATLSEADTTLSEADTTVMAPLKPVPTVSRNDRSSGLTTPKKAALVGAAVVTVALLTAGGLSMGTGMFTPAADSQSTAGTTAVAPKSTSAAPEPVSATTSPGSAPATADPGETDGAPVQPVSSGSARPAGTATPGAGSARGAAAPTSGSPAGSPASAVPAPAPQAPAPQAPPPQAPATQPPVQNPPASGGNGGNGGNGGDVTNGVGTGVGNAANGVGQGVGAVVGGVGQGVGAVLGGVGGVVGGVVGGLTG